MRTTGRFDTATPPDALRALGEDPAVLEGVPTLSDVRLVTRGTVQTVFAPVIALGPIALSTTISVVDETATGVRLRVVGRRGVQSADVDLSVDFAEAEAVAGAPRWTVTWTADLVVRGAAASVGQRVARDIATRAIGRLLEEAAAAAAVHA